MGRYFLFVVLDFTRNVFGLGDRAIWRNGEMASFVS